MKPEFKAGAAKIKITPPHGTIINGDFIPHYVKYIHDDLFAKALVFQQGDVEIAMVIVDICAMTKDFVDEAKVQISAATSIRRENILIAATHTHFAGSVSPLLLSPADLPYRQQLPSLIRESVINARKNLVPAKIAFGSTRVPEHVVCRRFFMKEGYAAHNPVTGGLDIVKTNPFGDEDKIDRRVSQVDSGLNYFAVRSTDDRWISVVANYSMHYVGDCPPGTITADYFGTFSSHLAELLEAPQDFVGMLSNGTSGEASIWDFIDADRYPKGDFEKSVLIGHDLAEKIAGTIPHLQWEPDPELSIQYNEINVGLRKPSAQELAEAKKVVADTDYEYLQLYNGLQVIHEELRRLYAREQVLLNEYPDNILFPIQVIKLGSGIIGALAGEFFSETGLWLKQQLGSEKYFTICFANGYTGYVPPADEIGMGGYETWRCRSSYLEASAENTIRNAIVQTIRSAD